MDLLTRKVYLSTTTAPVKTRIILAIGPTETSRDFGTSVTK